MNWIVFQREIGFIFEHSCQSVFYKELLVLIPGFDLK